MTAQTNHLLILPVPSRSHLRLLLQLTLNILELHPSTIATIIITSVTSSMLEQEIRLQSNMTRMEERLRVRQASDDLEQGAPAMARIQAVQKSVGPLLDEVLSGIGEDRFATIPCLVVHDLFLAFVRSAMRERTDALGIPNVPCLQYCPTMSVAQHRCINTTENYGSTEKMVERCLDNMKQGMEDTDAARKVASSCRCCDLRLMLCQGVPLRAE